MGSPFGRPDGGGPEPMDTSDRGEMQTGPLNPAPLVLGFRALAFAFGFGEPRNDGLPEPISRKALRRCFLRTTRGRRRPAARPPCVTGMEALQKERQIPVAVQ